MQQASGYTVVAEKINFYRFIAHFRMIHRGSFFAQLKTTAVRKLLPESWGFLTDHFDMAVLDNRGTGLNYPVQCDDYSFWNQDNFKLFPESEDEWRTNPCLG